MPLRQVQDAVALDVDRLSKFQSQEGARLDVPQRPAVFGDPTGHHVVVEGQRSSVPVRARVDLSFIRRGKVVLLLHFSRNKQVSI